MKKELEEYFDSIKTMQLISNDYSFYFTNWYIVNQNLERTFYNKDDLDLKISISSKRINVFIIFRENNKGNFYSHFETFIDEDKILKVKNSNNTGSSRKNRASEYKVSFRNSNSFIEFFNKRIIDFFSKNEKR